MCKISENLQLCTCSPEMLRTAKHTWRYSRYAPSENLMEGLVMPPIRIGEEIQKLNVETLLIAINARSCFDFDISPQERDLLEFMFTDIHEPGDYLTYAFRYKNGKWMHEHYDPFDTELTTVTEGRIENAW